MSEEYGSGVRDIVDITDTVPPEQRIRGRRSLIRALAGDFSFSASDFYECGLGVEIRRDQEVTLTGSFGPTVLGNSAGSLSFSVTEAVGQSITHHAGPCERCQLKAWKLNTTLWHWHVHSRLGRLRQLADEKILDPAPTVFSPDCLPNPKCSGCKDSFFQFREPAEISRQPRADPTVSYSTLLVEGLESGDIDALAALCSITVSDLSGRQSSNLSVSQPLIGQPVLLPRSSETFGPFDVRIVVVSIDSIDAAIGGVRVREGSVVPIAALAFSTGGISADAVLRGSEGHLLGQATKLDTTNYEPNVSMIWGFVPVPEKGRNSTRQDSILLTVSQTAPFTDRTIVIPVRYLDTD
jgi:hypothetical protein